ncbi:MAG: cbb3-type cytochrome c oxidase subunit I [Calditrichaeota bacterium]|nr:MAG: cbb3-type cytochrome c oxidase subunit I [Calditrichota bacterium]
MEATTIQSTRQPEPIILIQETTLTGEEQAQFKKLTLVWLTTALALFPILVILGLLMRGSQAAILKMSPELFYAFMTLHGLGMVGIWYIAGMAGAGLLLSRYVRPSLALSRGVFWATLVAVVLLIVATLIGKFITGWYFLYPLPLYPADVWKPWATLAFFAFLTIAGVAWTLWTVDYLRAIASRYSLKRALAWDVLFKKVKESDVPPMILILTVSLISALAGFLAAVVLIALFAAEALSSGFTNDALLMKNLVFYFGHVLVNITMYLGVAMVYELFPAFAEKGKLTTKWMVAAAWNASLLLVNLAYFHHLYMDFVQPGLLQKLGQIASYLVSVPAGVVTIISVLSLAFGSRMTWRLPSLLFFLGVMGWAIGGMAAVVDSTIVVNFRFHNTLWVPAHFHTYYLAGVVFMILGFAFQYAAELSGKAENLRLGRWLTALLTVGAYGFLSMFFYAGAHSVPRRYAVYPSEVHQGAGYAQVAIVFILLILTGVIIYLWEYGRRCVHAFSAHSH